MIVAKLRVTICVTHYSPLFRSNVRGSLSADKVMRGTGRQWGLGWIISLVLTSLYFCDDLTIHPGGRNLCCQWIIRSKGRDFDWTLASNQGAGDHYVGQNCVMCPSNYRQIYLGTGTDSSLHPGQHVPVQKWIQKWYFSECRVKMLTFWNLISVTYEVCRHFRDIRTHYHYMQLVRLALINQAATQTQFQPDGYL